MGRSKVTARQHRPAQRKLLPNDTGMEMVVEIELMSEESNGVCEQPWFRPYLAALEKAGSFRRVAEKEKPLWEDEQF
jgi:hypothetical protein